MRSFGFYCTRRKSLEYFGSTCWRPPHRHSLPSLYVLSLLKVPFVAGARANCAGQVTFAFKVRAERPHAFFVFSSHSCAASFLRWTVVDVSSLISWTAFNSNDPGPYMLYSYSLLWWILFLVPCSSFVCYQWTVILHRRFTGRVVKLPFFHRLTLALTSLVYVPALFVQVRHVTCSSFSNLPAPVLFEGCSDLYISRARALCTSLTASRYYDAIWCSSGCGSNDPTLHLTLTILSCFALLLFAVAVPLQYGQILRGCIVSNNAHMYEHNVKASELELITGLSWNYVRRYYYVVASFTRPWAFFSVWLQLLLLAWMLLTCLTMHSVSFNFMRALLLLIPLLLWTAGIVFRRPYRLFTSNVCLFCTVVALSLNCATFTLMASGDKSPFSALSTIEPFLQCINIAWPCIIVFGCLCSLSPLRDALPQKRVRWPVRLDSYDDAGSIVDTLASGECMSAANHTIVLCTHVRTM